MRFTTFKLYPEWWQKKYKDWYYTVHIFRTKKSMYSFRDDLEKEGASKMGKPHKYLACCSAYKNKKEPKQFGVLCFTKASAKRSGVVSHEFTHATTYWWKATRRGKRTNIFNNPAADERYARIQGYLVQHYWKTWYEINEKLKNTL